MDLILRETIDAAFRARLLEVLGPFLTSVKGCVIARGDQTVLTRAVPFAHASGPTNEAMLKLSYERHRGLHRVL